MGTNNLTPANGTEGKAGYCDDATAGAPPAGGPIDMGREMALAPLVDKIAYGFARSLVVALKELEEHIANETRKVGDSVGSRLDTMQASFFDLKQAFSEQRAATTALQESEARQDGELAALREQSDQFSASVAERFEGAAARHDADVAALREETGQFSAAAGTRIEALETRQETDVTALRGETKELTARHEVDITALRKEASELSAIVSTRIDAVTASLQEADSRQQAELAALRDETRAFAAAISEKTDSLFQELQVQQEDITAIKSSLTGFSTRADGLVERLDRQAEALRSIYSSYAQRETELEQLVEGFARLRAVPSTTPVNRL